MAAYSKLNKYEQYLDLDTKLMPTTTIDLGRTLRVEGNDQHFEAPEPMYTAVPHRVGQALVHAGQHMHGAHPVKSGTRMNIVLWLSVMKDFPRWLEFPHQAQ